MNSSGATLQLTWGSLHIRFPHSLFQGIQTEKGRSHSNKIHITRTVVVGTEESLRKKKLKKTTTQ